MKMFCPCCYKEHDIKNIKKVQTCELNDETIDVELEFFYCDISDATFENGMMLNKNLLKIKDEYRRKHDMLTSKEIENIRNKYKLSQTELSLILGFDETSIACYETKVIQSKEHDKILKNIRDDQNIFLEYLEKYRR